MLFRSQLVGRYDITCGMTGTATSAGDQFREFYGLHVSVIEPNVPCIRDDEPDRIYATTDDAFAALVDERLAQPVLIGRGAEIEQAIRDYQAGRFGPPM